MILDEILHVLKKSEFDKAYTVNAHTYTYSEFYKFVKNIYYFLKKQNINKAPVVIFGHKQIYTKAAFLACSFAGITYVPIDESMPKERVNSILEQVKPGLVIGNLDTEFCKTVTCDKIWKIMNIECFEDITEIALKPDDIYYIIFTSGSTGLPKGVKVTYKNLDTCVNWLRDITKMEKGVVLNQANFSFDLSVADLYLSLIAGSEHFILDNTQKIDFSKMFQELKNSKATLAVMTPSFADLLLLDKSFNEELMPELRKIIFCGEELLKSTVEKLYDRFKKIEIINCYGPTECTFAVTSIEIPRDLENVENIPVGKVKKRRKHRDFR